MFLDFAPGRSFQPSAVLAASYNPTSVPVSATVDNSASSSFGVLKAKASLNLTASTPVFAATNALAFFQDVITVSFPPFDGQRGLIQVGYTLSGTNSATGIFQTEASAAVIVSGPGLPSNQSCLQVYTSAVTAGVFSCPSTFQFIYGRPFALFFNLGLGIGTFDVNTASPRTGVGQGTGVSNFINTLVLSGLQIFDANGNPLPSAPTIEAASGTKYSASGILTPFAEFKIRELGIDKDGDRFHLNTNFKPGDGAPIINFLTDEVALQIGTFSTVIPAGSFHLRQPDSEDPGGESEAEYDFDGSVNGVRLRVRVLAIPDGSFEFKATGRGANFMGTMSPVRVNLEVGMNGDSAIKEIAASFGRELDER